MRALGQLRPSTCHHTLSLSGPAVCLRVNPCSWNAILFLAVGRQLAQPLCLRRGGETGSQAPASRSWHGQQEASRQTPGTGCAEGDGELCPPCTLRQPHTRQGEQTETALLPEAGTPIDSGGGWWERPHG